MTIPELTARATQFQTLREGLESRGVFEVKKILGKEITRLHRVEHIPAEQMFTVLSEMELSKPMEGWAKDYILKRCSKSLDREAQQGLIVHNLFSQFFTQCGALLEEEDQTFLRYCHAKQELRKCMQQFMNQGTTPTGLKATLGDKSAVVLKQVDKVAQEQSLHDIVKTASEFMREKHQFDQYSIPPEHPLERNKQAFAEKVRWLASRSEEMGALEKRAGLTDLSKEYQKLIRYLIEVNHNEIRDNPRENVEKPEDQRDLKTLATAVITNYMATYPNGLIPRLFAAEKAFIKAYELALRRGITPQRVEQLLQANGIADCLRTSVFFARSSSQ